MQTGIQTCLYLAW